MNRRQKGREGEELAVNFLRTKGYRILERNFRFDRGEIDIIAQEGETLVFVEVKARRSPSFAEAEEAVTGSKKRQLEKVAEGYLVERGIENRECRFDVIAVEFKETRPMIRHIVNAF
jgi:putative endonuclease